MSRGYINTEQLLERNLWLLFSYQVNSIIKSKFLVSPKLRDELRRNCNLAFLGSDLNSFQKLLREPNHCECLHNPGQLIVFHDLCDQWL